RDRTSPCCHPLLTRPSSSSAAGPSPGDAHVLGRPTLPRETTHLPRAASPSPCRQHSPCCSRPPRQVTSTYRPEICPFLRFPGPLRGRNFREEGASGYLRPSRGGWDLRPSRNGWV